MVNTFVKVHTIIKTNKPKEAVSFYREMFELKEPIILPHAPSHGHHIAIPISEFKEFYVRISLLDTMKSTYGASFDVMVDLKKTDQNAIVCLFNKGVTVDIYIPSNHELYAAICSNPLWIKNVIRK